MSVKLAFNRVEQFSNGTGVPYPGAKLFTYVGGSVNTKQTTYTESTGSVANTNPIVLDASGQLPQPIWLTTGVTYKFVLAPSTDTDPPTSPIWSLDGITGINDNSASQSEWISGPTPTFVSATSFTLVGDQTTTFQVGRRVKATVTAGTSYGTITASTFGAVTTVVVNTAGSNPIDVGLSAVSYGILSKTNDSMPRGIFPTMANMTGFISGLTYANNASDATNDLDIAAGRCVDSTGVDVLTVAAITKQSDVAWAVGTGAGGLDTGAVGNSDYYIWAIKRVDTGVTDVLYSLSSTAPTMPANYTLKRLIGWFKRVGGTIVAFHTYEVEGGGLEMNWDVPTLDINLANTLTTARRTDAVKVPLNFSTIANLNVVIRDAASSVVQISCPDQTDAAPSATAAPLGQIALQVAGVPVLSQMSIRTSAAGLIAARSDTATTDLYAVATIGFRWARRN